jgi:hypothetical protein
MKKVNFKNSVIALAIGLVMVSCGGGNSNKQQGGNSVTETKTDKADVIKFVSIEDLSIDGGTARLQIVLDKATPLMTGDVKSSVGTVDMVQNSSGNGTHWSVVILNVGQAKEITITVKPYKTTVEPYSRTIKVE